MCETQEWVSGLWAFEHGWIFCEVCQLWQNWLHGSDIVGRRRLKSWCEIDTSEIHSTGKFSFAVYIWHKNNAQNRKNEGNNQYHSISTEHSKCKNCPQVAREDGLIKFLCQIGHTPHQVGFMWCFQDWKLQKVCMPGFLLILQKQTQHRIWRTGSKIKNFMGFCSHNATQIYGVRLTMSMANRI